MFREMRRSRQALSREECEAILDRGTSGVLALSGDDGYPYAVPLSYNYQDGKLWFHCAREGHKLDALAGNPKASFCIIDADQVVPERYTTRYRSVIVFGKIRILTEEKEEREAIEKLAIKYFPGDSEEGRTGAIDRSHAAFYMLELTVEHMSGKEGLELTKERQTASL